jgi:hypothetical protein
MTAQREPGRDVAPAIAGAPLCRLARLWRAEATAKSAMLRADTKNRVSANQARSAADWRSQLP